MQRLAPPLPTSDGDQPDENAAKVMEPALTSHLTVHASTGDEDEHGAFDLFGPGTAASVPESAVSPGSASPTAFTLFPQVPLSPASRGLPPSAAAAMMAATPKEEIVEDDFVLFPTAIKTASGEEQAGVYPSYPSAVEVTEAPAQGPRQPPSRGYSQTQTQMQGMGVSPMPPQFKNAGNALDIIAVRSMDNRVFTTSWHVAFSWSRFRSNISAGVGDTVRVLVNGQELPTKMNLLERGRCIFTSGGLTPPTTDLVQIALFEDQPNIVRFEHFQRSSDTVRYVDSRLHLWGPNESVVVADLDGTLTISDVEGHIRTLRLGQYDYLHSGACDFFTKLHELDMRIVYLTARPIDWASASRTHLENAKQQTHTLPPGPLITNSNGLTGALFTEVVNKNPNVFKAQVLNEIQLTLIHAGRIVEHPVFVAGFGNRPTDVIAYEEVGMDPALVFLIDPYSSLRAASDPRIYESYSDPNALLWLLPKLKHKVPIEKVARIDDYTVRELVLAEDREQLLAAEREARRLQEAEYAMNTRYASSSSLASQGSIGRGYTYPS